MTIGGGAAAASRGVLTIENIKRDWDGARALGLPITMHTSGASPIMALEQAGLLGPDVQFIHPLLTTPEERAIMKARGASYSTSPQLESRRGSQLGVIHSAICSRPVKVSSRPTQLPPSLRSFTRCASFRAHSPRIGRAGPSR